MQYYIDQYQQNRSGDLPDFVVDVKDKAAEKLAGASFPSARDEKYLYTRVDALFKKKLSVYRPSRKDFSDNPVEEIPGEGVPAGDVHSIMFINGCMRGEPARRLPAGIVLGSFKDMIGQSSGVYRDFLSGFRLSDDVTVNLNTMLSSDGFFLFVPAGVKPDKPIRIDFLSEGRGNILIQPRNLIVMEAAGSADVMICDGTASDAAFLCNDVTDVVLGEGATLNLIRMQKMNASSDLLTHTEVRQEPASRMKTHYLTAGGSTVRNNLSVTLAGKNAEHAVRGLALTRETEHVDNNVHITHAAPECRSDQLFKHILSDTSTGAFTGRILVAGEAQKTTAYQRSSNILLHPKAKMNIRPQLEIYADDVKCSHGATIGRLDAEALFYLRSRGIGVNEAKKLLLRAFAGEVFDNIECEPFKSEIIRHLED